MAKVVALTGDPNRGKSPYYTYSRAEFDSISGVPPQVRAKKVEWDLAPSLDRGGYGVSGSLVAWNQGIMWRVWGKDEREAYLETAVLLRALEGTTFDGPMSVVNISGKWLPEDGDLDWKGEVVEFMTKLPVGVSNAASQLVTILTASGYVSSSLTGSFISVSGSGGYTHLEPHGKWTPWVHTSTTSSL